MSVGPDLSDDLQDYQILDTDYNKGGVVISSDGKTASATSWSSANVSFTRPLVAGQQVKFHAQSAGTICTWFTTCTPESIRSNDCHAGSIPCSQVTCGGIAQKFVSGKGDIFGFRVKIRRTRTGVEISCKDCNRGKIYFSSLVLDASPEAPISVIVHLNNRMFGDGVTKFSLLSQSNTALRCFVKQRDQLAENKKTMDAMAAAVARIERKLDNILLEEGDDVSRAFHAGDNSHEGKVLLDDSRLSTMSNLDSSRLSSTRKSSWFKKLKQGKSS